MCRAHGKSNQLIQVSLEIFYHNRAALQERLDQARNSDLIDTELIEDLEETAEFAEEEHATNIANLVPLLDADEITWELMWAIFPPNVLVYCYHPHIEEDQVLKVRAIRQVKRFYQQKYWKIDCRIVADDGAKFGLAYKPFLMKIGEFNEARKIVNLRIFPLKYHARAEEVHAKALSRGRRFAELYEPRVMQTSGPAMLEKRTTLWEPCPIKVASFGRMMIDLAAFRSTNLNIAFMPEVHRGLSREQLKEEELIVCTPVVFGFCFGNKKLGMQYPRSLKTMSHECLC